MRYISDREIAEAFGDNTNLTHHMNRMEIFNLLVNAASGCHLTLADLCMLRKLGVIKANNMPNEHGKAFMRQWLKDKS